MDDFREAWTDGPGYAAKNVERLRAFFQFCMDRDWIVRNPAKALKTHQPRPTPTLPYTDEEMARLIAACDCYRGNQDRMRAFVLTIRYSGLRISDMIALHPGQRVDDRLRLYTTKTGEPIRASSIWSWRQDRRSSHLSAPLEQGRSARHKGPCRLSPLAG